MKLQRFDVTALKEVRVKCNCGTIKLIDPKVQHEGHETLPSCNSSQECGRAENTVDDVVISLVRLLNNYARQKDPLINVTLEFDE